MKFSMFDPACALGPQRICIGRLAGLSGRRLETTNKQRVIRRDGGPFARRRHAFWFSIQWAGSKLGH